MNIEYEFYREQANKIWDDFSSNIKYINRYFVGNEILKTLENITKYSGISILNHVVYRARIGNFIDKDEKEIKAPPIGKSSDGRGNPRGISYFYTSTNIHTAIAEVRPDKGAMITVGTFENKENLHLIDFRSILIYENNRELYRCLYLH